LGKLNDFQNYSVPPPQIIDRNQDLYFKALRKEDNVSYHVPLLPIAFAPEDIDIFLTDFDIR